MSKSIHGKLPTFLKDALREKKQFAQRKFPDLKAAAFLDFDGSLIDGDITEGQKKGARTYSGLIDLAILGGTIPGFEGQEGLQRFWHKYENDFSDMKAAYLWAGQLVANLAHDEDRRLREVVIRHLGEMVEKYLFSFAHDLLMFCKTEEITPYVISASPHYFIQELGHFLPIAKENLFGLNGRMQNGELVDTILHDAAGKEQRVVELCTSRSLYPLFALGNKWHWDGGMIRRTCEEGGVGLLVNEGAPSNYTHPSLYYFNIC